MRGLFDQIVAEGEPAILQLVAEKRQEGVDLDFKEKANASTGEPDKNDRRVLGIALSALSNSMGGLLIWGVEARKNEDQVDCAIAKKPISQIDRFKGEVVRLLSQAIMPRHEGMIVEAVPSSSIPDAGYLLVLVDRSERRPHRCEIGESSISRGSAIAPWRWSTTTSKTASSGWSCLNSGSSMSFEKA
jgi:predicted HTH transcriptional regulator